MIPTGNKNASGFHSATVANKKVSFSEHSAYAAELNEPPQILPHLHGAHLSQRRGGKKTRRFAVR
jgi:hypothetical protein